MRPYCVKSLDNTASILCGPFLVWTHFCADKNGLVRECEGDTGIYIYPGYKFKCLDGLITNFHLPESTLLMLVSALAGRENVLNAYNEAVKEKYKFFSFGDAMFIK